MTTNFLKAFQNKDFNGFIFYRTPYQQRTIVAKIIFVQETIAEEQNIVREMEKEKAGKSNTIKVHVVLRLTKGIADLGGRQLYQYLQKNDLTRRNDDHKYRWLHHSLISNSKNLFSRISEEHLPLSS